MAIQDRIGVVIAVKSTQKYVWYVTIFSTMSCCVTHATYFYISTVFCYVTSVTLLLSFNQMNKQPDKTEATEPTTIQR